MTELYVKTIRPEGRPTAVGGKYLKYVDVMENNTPLENK